MFRKDYMLTASSPSYFKGHSRSSRSATQAVKKEVQQKLHYATEEASFQRWLDNLSGNPSAPKISEISEQKPPTQEELNKNYYAETEKRGFNLPRTIPTFPRRAKSFTNLPPSVPVQPIHRRQSVVVRNSPFQFPSIARHASSEQQRTHKNASSSRATNSDITSHNNRLASSSEFSKRNPQATKADAEVTAKTVQLNQFCDTDKYSAHSSDLSL